MDAALVRALSLDFFLSYIVIPVPAGRNLGSAVRIGVSPRTGALVARTGLNCAESRF